MKQFFDSGIFSIGFDNQRRPIWFINTEHYDDTFGMEIITKASELWVTSLLWNLAKNEYDLFLKLIINTIENYNKNSKDIV